MSLNLTNFFSIEIGISILFLAWAVVQTRRRYADTASWKNSTLVVLLTVFLTVLSGVATTIGLVLLLQHWVNEEMLERIVFIALISVMYITFRFLLKRLEPIFLKPSSIAKANR